MIEHHWVKAHGDISTCTRCGVVTQTDGSYDGGDCPGLDVADELAGLRGKAVREELARLRARDEAAEEMEPLC